jgi:hypothetical protein
MFSFAFQVDCLVSNMQAQPISRPHTRHDCQAEFMRFKKANETYHSARNEGITYKQYNSNSFIAGFDLATTELEDVNESINTVQSSSSIRIDVQFSEALQKETTMIAYCVYTNSVVVTDDHQVLLSYANNIN